MSNDARPNGSFIAAASQLVGRTGDPNAGELYQTSLMSALVDGVYEGTTTYGELHRHGDFGLGTFNDLDGEMVGFDGSFYQLRSDGSARKVTDDQRTPFAVVTFFKPASQFSIGPSNKDAVLKAIEAATEGNLFTAIRIDGRFRRMTTRTVRKQERPFPPLQDAAKGQKETMVEHIEGTLAGYRTPAYAGSLNVPGFHLHFLAADRNSGGHMLDFEVEEATVGLCPLHSFHAELPETAAFLKAGLNSPDIEEKIAAAEGGSVTTHSH